ncbi:MAG: hypothetical protein OXO54_04975 [Chloroflexota bacterium]|nr:hypothetical protein [Chloroflexota bacterium]MDE2897654.1 hypothetical protein [Chloroflexota bacterium]
MQRSPGSVRAGLAGVSWIARDEERDLGVSSEMRPVHPGEVLGEGLDELGLSASALARA